MRTGQGGGGWGVENLESCKDRIKRFNSYENALTVIIQTFTFNIDKLTQFRSTYYMFGFNE